jgi:hypothetical protein
MIGSIAQVRTTNPITTAMRAIVTGDIPTDRNARMRTSGANRMAICAPLDSRDSHIQNRTS